MPSHAHSVQVEPTEDVMDVDYVAWQADHDAYGFSGQNLGSRGGK